MASHLGFNDVYRILEDGGEEVWWRELDEELGRDWTH